AENMFGKDAGLPETKISYRVQSKVGRNTAIQGRDQTYLMPPQSIRVMSLVPADASDIRDTSAETFGDIDQRAFRANLFTVIGATLFVVAGLLALLALVRLVRRYRTAATATERPITDGAILRGVGRELAALRVAATYAVGRRVGYQMINPRLRPAESLLSDGRLVLRSGLFRGKPIAVSGAITAQSVARELARGGVPANARRTAMLESLAQALSAFTVAGYSRDGK